MKPTSEAANDVRIDAVNDVRYAARMLANTPGFTLVAASLLAAGIGANTLIFSALDAVLLRNLPVRHPEALVRMVQKSPQLGTRSSFEYAFYEALRDRSATLAAVFGERESPIAMNEPAPAEEIQAGLVTPEFFDVLGVAALHGRTLTPADARDDPGPPPAVLSYGFWRKRFDADPRAVGRAIVLRGHKFVIVGVMPREFNGVSMDTSPDVRLPIRVAPLLVDFDNASIVRVSQLTDLSIAGRLKPGATREQAQAECLAIWRTATVAFYQQHAEFGDVENELARGIELDPLQRGVSILRDHYGNALKLLVGSAGLLLLMICANVSGLVLAKNSGRREEIAVRLALGATRARLVRQMLTESGLLVAMGAVGGLLLAYISAPLLVRALPPLRDLRTTRLNLAIQIGLDRRALLFTAAVAAITVLLSGLAPAMASARTSLDGVLRGARSSGAWRGRRALIVFQLALCTLLLAGAGLLVRTLDRLRGVDPGFDADHIVTFTAEPSLASYTPAQAESLRLALTGRVRNIPGVVSVAVAGHALMRGSGVKMTVAPMGQRPAAADFLNTSMNVITSDYFETMGMHIVDGRDFAPQDWHSQTPPVRVVVNQAFAAKIFPGVAPVGRRFTNGRSPVGYEIVGVVSDAKYRSLREPMTPTLYMVWSSEAVQPLEIEVRTRVPPQSIIEPVRRALAALDPALPFTEIETMSDEVAASTAGERLTAALASIFGALAAILAAIGIYGLLAHAVAQRRREIGIRMAVGARPADIVRMIGWQSLAMVAAGIALGLGASALAAPALKSEFSSLLYGVAPSDPVSLSAAALFVALIAAAATALPAAYAAHIEPATALKEN